MSWSDQNAGAFQEQSDINVLKQNYANAELAYQSLNRDYQATLAELEKTQQIINRVNEKINETNHEFSKVKQEVAEKVNQINQLTSTNQKLFEELTQHKERLDTKVSLLVAEQMEEYKSDIIRMDRFTEYFPTVISLIALASILYFIFGT
ncbi:MULTISPECIES: hypothetical protein [Enterococcaceae]|uniref:Mobilization protein n=2 Tax=Enterococcaceae TaxID=81852 RepID=A0ABU3FDQ4_9ENTE|nr:MULTISPECIES: hypothetical protein [Enterococcaceae]MDT2472651.1 hypothetical protein [Enterococcus avium]MDT2760819.1 hypothetical protein [Enterococcus xiangfangensis]MDT2832245.1 hypothetical protein [Vagococcus carniphilus]MDT2855753.1 hypothetical protein [Vagococcus carniphilus]